MIPHGGGTTRAGGRGPRAQEEADGGLLLLHCSCCGPSPLPDPSPCPTHPLPLQLIASLWVLGQREPRDPEQMGTQAPPTSGYQERLTLT